MANDVISRRGLSRWEFGVVAAAVVLCPSVNSYAQDSAEDAIASDDLDLAARLLQKAHDRTRDPATLLRLCEVHAAKASWAKARKCLERQQKDEKDPGRLAKGAALLAQVKDRAAGRGKGPIPIEAGAAKPVDTGPKPTPIPVATAGGRASAFPWHWVAIGSGVALLAGGGIMTGLAWGDRMKLKEAERTGDVVTGMTRTEAGALWSRARTKEKVSIAFYALGGAAVAGGVVMWIIDSRRGGSAAVPAVAPVAGGMVFGATGRF